MGRKVLGNMKHLLLALCSLVFVCGCTDYGERVRVAREELLRNHPEWSAEVKAAIRKDTIRTGMTVKQVGWALWDGILPYPDENGSSEMNLISETSRGNSTYTVPWRKEGYHYGTMYLFFQDGKLKSWSWADISPF